MAWFTIKVTFLRLSKSRIGTAHQLTKIILTYTNTERNNNVEVSSKQIRNSGISKLLNF